MKDAWTERENAILRDAMKNGVNVDKIVKIVTSKTNKTELNIIEKLHELDYFKTHDRAFETGYHLLHKE